MRIWLGYVLALLFSAAACGVEISERDEPGALAIVSGDTVASIYADPNDVQPTSIAANLLAEDVARVTGKTPKLVTDPAQLSGDAILVGTIGHSALIDQLIAQSKLDVGDIRGQWESFKLQVIENPTPSIRRALVIIGSDRRGTAYGVFHLSEAIGVSPWYWWADVPPKKKSSLFVLPGTTKDGPPVVRYRGIFLNDEAPALTGWVREKFGDYNHAFYVKVFELLLRLRANYLWPAMWNNCFNEDDPLNPKLANDWGIVMGTSHVEPLMRADKEWNRKGYTEHQWNYDKFPNELTSFWREGLVRNKPYENLITIAMRGKIDTPMSEEANVALLERIVRDQRKLIAEVIDPDVSNVPQLWALYKEVQEYYERGMRVPDDVTLLWCDDNWGNIRRLPTPEERKRSGGAGVYYHFDYVGGPRSYKWLNTVPLPKIWEQMNLAHQYGADRVWIVNVGDLKPMEFPLSFFIAMAWNPDRIPKEQIREFGTRWAEQQFGPEHAGEIADILAKYTKYNGRRKPELLEPDTYSLVNYQEAERVVGDFNAIAARAEVISRELPESSRDAFYELVLHPTKASAIVTELYATAGRNRLYASQGRASANALAERTRELFRADAAMSDYYNHTLAGGKWNHMMDQTHLGYVAWYQPMRDAMPAVAEVRVREPAELGVEVEGSPGAWPGTWGDPVLPTIDSLNQQRRYVEVFNRGLTPFEFEAAASEPWITLSATSGKVKDDVRLWIGVDWSKASTGKSIGSVKITRRGGGPEESATVKVSAFNPTDVTRDNLDGFVEADGYVAMEAEHFTRKVDAGSTRWDVIPDHGRTLSSMTVFPVTSASVMPPASSPCLEYRMYLFSSGKVNVTATLAPTLNFVPGRGLRYAVSFEDDQPVVVDALAKNTLKDWERSVEDGVRNISTELTVPAPGYHTLKFQMVDPGVVLQRLVVDAGGVRPSYLGPPESFRHVK